MTNEEAIKHGKDQLEIFGEEHKAFIELAIEALEKQIPKKPIEDRGWLWCCPVCKTQFQDDGVGNFCEHCGQAIDWR